MIGALEQKNNGKEAARDEPTDQKTALAMKRLQRLEQLGSNRDSTRTKQKL